MYIMKATKKIVSILLAVVLTMALCVSAFAGSITVNNAVDNETYTAYKIFDVTYEGSNATDPHSYTVQAPWLSVVQGYLTGTHAGELTLTQIGTSGVYNVKNINLDAAAFAAYLMANIPTGASSTSATAASNSATLTVSTAGYYLVDSTFGALCALYTADDSFAFEEKNAKPTVEKTVDGADSADASIGDTVPFTLTVNTGTETATGLGTGNDGDITLTDTMQNLTIVETSGSYVTMPTGWTKGTDYTEAWDASTKTLTIVLKTSKLATLAENTDIAISYSATVDKAAVTATTGNVNTVTLTYKHYTMSDTATVLTYEFDICKTDSEDKFITDATGAKFELYSDSTCTSKVNLIYDSTLGAYRPTVGTEAAEVIDMSTSGRGAKAKIYGLAAGTYYLKETVAPVGYNLLETPAEVTLTANNTNADTATVGAAYTSGGIQVENNTGVELPSTGGTGTMLLIVFGCILFMGTAIVLVTKKRMYNEGR